MILTARESIALAGYRTLLYALAPTLGPLYLVGRWLRRQPFVSLRDRFGFATGASNASGGGVWLHAVSVGEVLAARILAASLREAPCAIRLSATTVTGLRLAQEAAARGEVEAAASSPLDYPGAVRRHFASARPALLVLMEAEIWPTWLNEARRLEIPVALVNARVSERSTSRYARLPALFRPALRTFDVVAARTADDAERLVRLGVEPDRVTVTGDLKFDSPDPRWSAAEARAELRLPVDGPVIVAGSVHPGEDAVVLDAFSQLRAKHPTATMVLAPRKEAPAGNRELPMFRRTDGQPVPAGGVLVLDTLGELRDAYAAASVAFVGGSLVPIGGHNLLEPAAASVPVLFGPHTRHHQDPAARLLAARGGFRVAEGGRLAIELERLVSDEPACRAAGAAARSVVESGRGATVATVALLRPLLERGMRRSVGGR